MNVPMDLEVEVTTLLAGFRLPTAWQEMVRRVREAGHEAALPAIGVRNRHPEASADPYVTIGQTRQTLIGSEPS